MILSALVLVAINLVIAQSPLEASKPSSLEGHWRIVGNGTSGYLIISNEADGTIKGKLYDETFDGTFDPDSRQVMIRRLIRGDDGKFSVVQEFRGELRQDGEPSATLTMLGTFRSVSGPNWGQEGVDYKGSATRLQGTVLEEQLKELHGRWEVVSAQKASAAKKSLPESCPLASKGAFLEIRNNQVFHEGQLVATLANDLRMPDPMEAMRPSRRPLMMTLTNGTAYLVAYDGRSPQSLEIVFPHTTGNVGVAQFLYWKRLDSESEKHPAPKTP